MDKQSIIADEARYMMQTYGRADVVLARGEGVHLYDSDGRRYLDFMSGIAVAALGADTLDFVSNVPGVLANDALLPHLSPEAAEALIADGTIAGGMIPKVRAALDALARGVAQVQIVDLAGLRSGGGTVFSGQ